jgi:hypothetical protein
MITSRSKLTDYCLRQLGAPVLQINVAPEQIVDRLDDALQKFWDFHGDGEQVRYLMYQISEKDVTNEYIELDENITAVVRLFPLTSAYNSGNLQFQSYISDLMNYQTTTAVGVHGYVISQMHLSMLQDMFAPEKRIRYNRYTNTLRIDDSWEEMRVGSFIVFECYSTVDPLEYNNAYNDPWLKAYATALIKRQWGQNLLKYQGVVLPSGIVLDGRAIYEDARADIEKLEQELYNIYQLPPDFCVG